MDEVNLARNLIERGFFDYLHPLDYNQHAPILFLWLLDLITKILGHSELALRLWPFIAGVLSIIVFQEILRKIHLPWPMVVTGTFLLGLNIVSVKYGLEVKQYSTDLLVATLLIMFWKNYEDGIISARTLLIFGVVSIFLSMPAIFILLAICMVGLLHKWKERNQLLPVFIGWGIVFLINYFFFLRPSIEQHHLQEYHNAYFFTLPHDSESLNQFFEQIVMFIRGPFGKTLLAIIIAFLFIIIGVARKWENRINQISFCVILLVLMASLFRKYSILERLMLFTYPFFYILFLSGIYAVWEIISRKKSQWSKWYAGVVMILLFIVFSNDERFVWFPEADTYGESVRDGLYSLDQSKLILPIVLTHNAWPYYDYYVVKRGLDLPRNNEDIFIMNWEASQLDSLLSTDNKITLLDAHTFGEEKEKLQRKMKTYSVQEISHNQDFTAWIVHNNY